MSQSNDDGIKIPNEEGTLPDSKPIEPKGKKLGKISLLKGLLFLLLILYIVISSYHAPILTALGKFLIVKHEPQSSDLIVCLAGGNIERGLASAELYKAGMAPRIFMAQEETPDGYERLKEKGVSYPVNIDLLVMMLEGLGVPDSAIFTSDRTVHSTYNEALAIRDFIRNKGYRSLILVTTPIHTRRSWLTFNKVFEEDDIRILVVPSAYSGFDSKDWWQKRAYVREVIIEYQKLIYYFFKYLL
jgi:uncharacterized SAM-binding protein YcdF (DUF218 family)